MLKADEWCWGVLHCGASRRRKGARAEGLSGTPRHPPGFVVLRAMRRFHIIRCSRSVAPYGLPGFRRSLQQSNQLPWALGRHRKALGSTPV